MKRISYVMSGVVVAWCMAHIGLQPAYAAEVVAPHPLLITEIQTGAGTAGDEFIELYNNGAETLLLDGWQVRTINAEADATTLLATIGSKDQLLALPSHSYFVLRTATVPVPDTVLSQVYDAKLSSTDKTVALFAPDYTACQLTVRDALGWGTSTHTEASSIAIAGEGDKLIYRFDSAGLYIDSNVNRDDAAAILAVADTTMASRAIAASPGMQNNQSRAEPVVTPLPGRPAPLAPVRMSNCAPPAPPLQPEVPPASAQVTTPAQSPPSVRESAVKDDIAAARNVGLLMPLISELLPNPAKPQTDAADEFIELYNPNKATFDLSGYVLAVGVNANKKYTFPEGTQLAAGSFQAFMTADTRLTLANAQGQVRLFGPHGNEIAASAAYGAAKDGQAWVFAESTWQWTATPSPGRLNILQPPGAKQSSGKSAESKNTNGVVQGATRSAAQASPNASAAVTEMNDAEDGFNPLHPVVLVVTGVAAVSYGLYEYRTDLANKLHQFRANRAARRALGQAVEGRRDNRAGK